MGVYVTKLTKVNQIKVCKYLHTFIPAGLRGI